jgi:outer membrane lipoprotein SlyB
LAIEQHKGLQFAALFYSVYVRHNGTIGIKQTRLQRFTDDTLSGFYWGVLPPIITSWHEENSCISQEVGMEEKKTSNRIHPLMAGAAVSVMLVSLVGVAAVTGLIPSSHSTAAPSAASASNAPAVGTAASSPSALVDPKTQSKIAADDMHKSQRDSAPRTAQNKHSQSRAGSGDSTTVAQAPSVCETCGRVESVHAVKQEGKGSGLGIAAGAVLGGVLGNQVGGGNGKTLATVAGAVGGGYAGNEVEKHARSTTSYSVRVRMEDGKIRTFPYAGQPGWNVGDRVRVVDGKLTSRA